MYYDGELINKAIEILKNADLYLKNADNYTGKNLVDDCQAISDSLNSKKNKISGLAITAEELGTFNKNVISSNNDKENDENYYKFDGNFDFLEEKIEKSKDEDLMENYMFQIYIQQMLNTSELNEEEQIIAQKYIDSGNNSALLYFLMVKETENNIKSLENEREKFHEMKISDFINMLKENGSIPEDYKLNINGDLTVFYIRENGADLQTLIGNEIINLIHDYDLRYLQEIQKLKQEKYTYKQELKKAEYALEFEKEYKILPIPQEQMNLIETFLNDYIKRFDTYNNSESFLEMLNYFNITNDEKINPYNLLLYLQVFPESLSTYLNIRDQMNVKIPNINSTTDLIDFLELNGIITFGLDEAGLYPQLEAYKYLEPEVLCVYQNILYNEGEEAASKFLEVYQDDINKAKGYEQAIECINSLLENKTDFQTVVQSLGIGTKDGIMAYFDGWAKIFDKEGLMTVNDYRTQFFMQLLLSSESIDKNELEKSLTNGDITASEYNTQMSIVDWSLKSDNLKSWCSTFYSVGTSVGQQIPSLAFSYLTMGIGSSIVLTGGALTKAAKMAYSISMFGSQFGTEKSNAIRKGSSQEIAFLYALMKAGSETAVENLFQIPGIPEEGLIKINGTDSKLMKIIKLIGSNFIEKPAGEIVEELIQNVIEGEIEYGFYAEEYTFSEWINSLSDTAITTYISTLILGANGIISDVANIKKGIIIKFSDNTEISFTPNQLQHLCEKSGLEISDGQITNVDTKTFKQEINNRLNSLSPEQRTEVINSTNSISGIQVMHETNPELAEVKLQEFNKSAQQLGLPSLSFDGEGNISIYDKGLDLGNDVHVQSAQESSDVSIADVNSRRIIGGSYDNIYNICKKYGITVDDFLYLTRTPQHKMTIEQKKLVYGIRMELTKDVTNNYGVVKPGTRMIKSIDQKTYESYYQDGMLASVSGCIALARDVVPLGGNAGEIVGRTGLIFEGSGFVDENNKAGRIFYQIEFYAPNQEINGGKVLTTRVSATTDAVTLSKVVSEKFNEKYPNYRYKGMPIDYVGDINAPYEANNSYLNERWTRNSLSQLDVLSAVSGIPKANIVTEEARFYNRPNNPDTGNGFTLNQSDSSSFGIPEFFVKGGRVNVNSGAIYMIADGNRVKVADIINGVICTIN